MAENKAAKISNREVKASAFTVLFSDPKNAAQLYSALEGTQVEPEDIHFTTLEGVLFVARKNDMAFTVKNRVLVISEHQSTLNSNMPLRDVIYYGRTMEKLIEPKALYRNKQIPIPTPEFFVFYNGDEPFPSEKICNSSAIWKCQREGAVQRAYGNARRRTAVFLTGRKATGRRTHDVYASGSGGMDADSPAVLCLFISFLRPVRKTQFEGVFPQALCTAPLPALPV